MENFHSGLAGEVAKNVRGNICGHLRSRTEPLPEKFWENIWTLSVVSESILIHRSKPTHTLEETHIQLHMFQLHQTHQTCVQIKQEGVDVKQQLDKQARL